MRLDAFGSHESARFLIATVVLAALYLALEPIWSLLASSTLARGISKSAGPSRSALAEQAHAIALESEAADARAGPGGRALAFQLGELLGYEDATTCRFSTLGQPRPPAAERLSLMRRNTAHGLAQAIGIGSAAPLPCRTGNDALQLSARTDTDEDGTARRIATVLSTRHREWFLLGRHVGLFEADLQWVIALASPELQRDALELTLSREPQIVIHGILAGTDPQLVAPFENAPPSGDPREAAEWLAGRVQILKRSIGGEPVNQ